MKIQLDMYQTIAVAVVVLMLGKFLKKRCSVLERFCIPAPVIAEYFLQFLRASVMPPGLQNLNLTIF